MPGVYWAAIAGIGFGIFQALNRRGARGMDTYKATFILLSVSALILIVASILTEDLSLLATASWHSYANFAIAGFIHFFVGWTFLSISQKRIGAARTGALLGTTPLFAVMVGFLAFNEALSPPVLLGIFAVVAGVYLVSNG